MRHGKTYSSLSVGVNLVLNDCEAMTWAMTPRSYPYRSEPNEAKTPTRNWYHAGGRAMVRMFRLSSTRNIRSLKQCGCSDDIPQLPTQGRSPVLYTRRSQCYRELHPKVSPPRMQHLCRQGGNLVPGIESSPSFANPVDRPWSHLLATPTTTIHQQHHLGNQCRPTPPSSASKPLPRRRRRLQQRAT